MVSRREHRIRHWTVIDETLDGHSPALRFTQVVLQLVKGAEAQGYGHLFTLACRRLLEQVGRYAQVAFVVVSILLDRIFFKKAGQADVASGCDRTPRDARFDLAFFAPNASAPNDVGQLDNLTSRVAIDFPLQTQTLFSQTHPVDGLFFVKGVKGFFEQHLTARLYFTHLVELVR